MTSYHVTVIQVKEEKWSVAMETVVEVIGAVLAPASNLVAVYQEGDAETRAEVCGQVCIRRCFLDVVLCDIFTQR